MMKKKEDRFYQIGIDREISLEMLEKTVNMHLAGNDRAAIKEFLNASLREKLPAISDSVRGTRSKTITILMKIWVSVPSEMEEFRNSGLELLQILPREKHIGIHWGMTMAVYPFWGIVAANVGRLLRLQENFSSSQVQKRVKEKYGERETVFRSVNRLLRSFIDWGILTKTREKGVYTHGKPVSIDNPKMIAWLFEAILNSRPEGKAPLGELTKSMSLFPFLLAPITAASVVSNSSRLELVRHGLSDELIVLRND